MEKKPVDQILGEFRNKISLFNRAGKSTEDLIKQLLEQEGILVHSVNGRVKSESKLREKYLRPDKNYTQLNDITDQVGVRITTYYEDQVDPVSEVILKNFHIYPQHTVDTRKQDPQRFGYRSLHHVCSCLEARSHLPEYKLFADVMIEIQIRSILQHAWAEMEHDSYDLRGDIPDHIRRRFSRLAGLLELADQEFVEVRKEKERYISSVSVMIEADVIETSAVDVLSVKALIEKEPLVGKLDRDISLLRLKRPITYSAADLIANNVVVGAKCAEIRTLDELRKELARYKDCIVDFAVEWAKLRRPKVTGTVSPIGSGYVLAQLVILLIAPRGASAIAEFAAQLGRNIIPPEAEPSDFVTLAKKFVLPA